MRPARWVPARHRRLRRYWWAVAVAAVGLGVQALGVWRVLHELDPGERPMLLDSIIFEYVGWAVTDGATLYVDVWEIKPPLAFVVPSLLALVPWGTGWYHWANVAATSALAVGAAVAVGALAHELTGDGVAALAAGLTLYALPAYHWRAAIGFKAKYLVVLAGILGVVLALRHRWLWAGVAAGVAAGTWQLAIGFLVPPALIAARRDRAAFARVAAGIVAVAVASLIPVVAWGAVEAMVTEVVVTPLLYPPPRDLAAMRGVLTRALELTLPLVAVGGYGLARSVAGRAPGRWWLPATAVWFAAVLAVDLDALPDLFPILAVLGVCVGVAIAGARDRVRTGVAMLVVALVVANALTLGGTVERPLAVPDPTPVDEGAVAAPYSPAERRVVFWDRRHAASCRPFIGGTQAQLIRAAGLDQVGSRCGDLAPVVDGTWLGFAATLSTPIRPTADPRWWSPLTRNPSTGSG